MSITWANGVPPTPQEELAFEESKFSALKAGIPKVSATSLHVPGKTERWITISTPDFVLMKGMIAKLNKTTAMLYLVGVFQYVGVDHPDVEFCVYWNRMDVILNCQNHNKQD
jgi:hypothetical protein